LLKCTYSDIIGHTPFVFFSGIKKKNIKSIENAMTKIDKALLGKPQFFEWINRRKDGTLFETEVSLNNIVVGDDNYLQAIIRDVSERKEYERNLIESENKFRDFAEKSIVGVYLLQDERLKYANDKLSQLFGYTVEEITNKCTFRDLIHPDDLELFESNINSRLNGKINTLNYQLRCITKNSDVFYVEVYGSRTIYEGKPAIVGSLIDISEKRKADLEIIVAKEEAEKSNRLKSEFLAQMSHEIRTPVNSILSFASLIKEELEEYLPSELANSFSIMNRAGKRIIRTIDLILNMSQLQTGTFEYLPVKFDVFGKIVENLYLEYKKLANEKNLELYLESDSRFEHFDIFADEYTVYQIFTNLIDNAIKYTNRGYISLYLSKDTEDNIYIEVKDTGIGISEEYLPYIFDAFSQEDQGYTRKFEGNGLGLALVKEYCRLNKALINVKSKKVPGPNSK
jgi:PAS domain S-box-containing protein